MTVIYSSADTHCQQCASAEEKMTWSNELTLLVMVLGQWNVTRMMVERMMKKMVLGLGR